MGNPRIMGRNSCGSEGKLSGDNEEGLTGEERSGKSLKSEVFYI